MYVLRNPKDVLVSLYHFAHSWVLLDSPKSFEEFFKQFVDGKRELPYFTAPPHIRLHRLFTCTVLEQISLDRGFLM